MKSPRSLTFLGILLIAGESLLLPTADFFAAG